MRLAAIKRRLRADAGLDPGRRSFFLRPKGKPKGAVLLLHGFSACPWELKECGLHLQKKGYLAYAPRLAGHGLETADFNAQGRADWMADAEASLGEIGPGAVVIGHSMGGLLAALLAARSPSKIRALVLAAPAFRLAPLLASLSVIPLARWFKPNVHVKPLHPDSIYWTLDYASDRIAELVRLGREATRPALELKLPLLMLQASRDDLVSAPFNVNLFPKILSEQKKLLVYDTPEHNVFHRYNPQRREVFSCLDRFLNSLAR